MLSEQGTHRCLNQYIIGGENNIQKKSEEQHKNMLVE
jgi:hypothetical protein